MTVIATIIAIAIIDLVGAHVFKPLIARPRPCHLEIGRLLVRCGTGYAMPSLHAANTFGVFTPIVWRYKWKAAPLYIISILVSYSRIYVGVHWPLDVVVGMLWGVAVGWGVCWLFFRKEVIETETAE
ncbi:MAG TPA: phosphatase PAP2 family protein [candidate division Zixibacteria bacterium]|nr:phosphatase PAP2 family protein [candidate division Zixibacteria bacterium]